MILALLSISVASAGDLSSLNTTDAQNSVSVYDESNINLNNDGATVLEGDNSNVISSKEDVDSQSQSNSNVIKESNNVKNFTNLQEEINAKSDNSVLDLDCNYTYNGESNFHGISIHKNNFTIDGHGHTIDADNRVNIFTVGWGNITLKNLILINAYTKDTGAAVDIFNNPYGTVYISNCTFINNHANNDIDSLGGAINDGECGALIISNCSFINNTAYQGGAIHTFVDAYRSNLTINNCFFINNSANMTGGAIWNVMSIFIVNNCSFVNNSASGVGGAISNVNLDNCSIVNNCSFINNAASQGGAIYNVAANLTVGNCSFINNTANQGVAIYNDYYYYYDETHDYEIIGRGTINLINNTYSGITSDKTYIYINNGTILTPVTITVLGNQTIETESGEKVILFAIITTEDGASVSGGTLKFIVNGSMQTTNATTNDDGNYTSAYTPDVDGMYLVNATYGCANNITVKTGIIDSFSGVNLTTADVVMIYKDESRLYATLLNPRGSPIANATIFFTINGMTYNKTTDANGSASIAINLDYGTYTAVISYENNTVNATVTVKPSIIGNDLVKMWMNGTQFYATFLGKGATPLANTNVTFNINGVFYTRSTNENGTAKLNINLDSGNYTLTAYNPYNKEERGFNVLVKPLIETTDLTKYYNNESKFEAKVYNYDGSLAANKTVTFNINGVFYNRTADENGIVKLAITLRPGDYIITSMYEGLSIGNNVKVIPTLETSDLSMTQDDGSTFNVRTLDGQGNPLVNQEVTFNIHGVFYHKTTDSNGVANLNINLMKGEYIITSYWKDYEIGNKIEVL